MEENTSWLSRLKLFLKANPKSKEELTQILRDAKTSGIIDAETLSMIESVLLFNQLKVRDIMLPKQQMVCITSNLEYHEILDIVTQTGHSRFPVLHHESNEVLGILHAKDLLSYQGNIKHTVFELSDIIREASHIPESQRLNLLLRDFKNNRNHMAIVVDEYGSISGFITIEDIVEQIMGEIEDEFDIEEENYIKSHGNARFILKAITPIELFNKELNANFSDKTHDTVGGYIATQFGYLPKRHEKLTVGDFEFTVLSADARHIKLLECLDKRQYSAENLNHGD